MATIGEVTFRDSDVDAQWAKDDPTSFNEIHQRTYIAKKQALDRLLSDYLLSAEAKKRGITAEELQRYIASNVPAASEEEMRAVYEREKPSGLIFEDVKAEIADYLRRQAVARVETKFVEDLGRSAVIALTPFRHPIKVDAGDRTIGTAAPKVEFVEFADFECPYCKQVEPSVQKLREKYGDKIRSVWKDYPLPIHANAKGAAEAALCANDQSAFWKYHDVLFANQSSLASADLKNYATQLGLEMKSFEECVDGGKYRVQIGNAASNAAQEGVPATPAMFINGRPIIGAAEFETLDFLVSKELAAPQTTWRIGP